MLNTEQQRMIVARICKMFNVRYRFVDSKKELEGWAKLTKNCVFFPKHERDINTLVSVALHEIVHIIAKRQGKFEHYHTGDTNNWTRKDFIVYKRTAMLAEMYIDQRAEKLAAMYFPHIQYVQSYREPTSRAIVQKGCNEWANQSMVYQAYHKQQNRKS